MKCSIDLCDKHIKLKERKLCSAHYARYLRHGNEFDKSPIKDVSLNIHQRIANKISVATESGCFEWTGSVNKKGYGVIGIGSRLDGTRKIVNVHRLIYELYVQKIPEGLYVLHKCDNRKCVSFDHLFLGTAKDNTMDMIRKNRHANKKGIIPIQFEKYIFRNQ